MKYMLLMYANESAVPKTPEDTTSRFADGLVCPDGRNERRRGAAIEHTGFPQSPMRRPCAFERVRR